jgi:predicted NAD/FAD-binding protein
MRIAVIGSGISGMVAAYRLCAEHEVSLYEAGAYIGGHTHTVDVQIGARHYAIDTGFIVHNDWTYPNFIALLKELGVRSQDSAMSFSVRCEASGLEYNGTSMNSLFAQRLNLLRPSFLRMVRDILRFNKEAPALLAADAPDESLGEYLREHGYSRFFVDNYIVPMAASVWSSRPAEIQEFPARFLVRFFANHGFLNVNDRPTWRVIRGGSREYVKRLTAPYAARIHLNRAVDSLVRQPGRVCVRFRNGSVENFDQVFIACHSDQALQLLGDASPAERAILGAIPYQENEVLLHTDSSLMPRKRLAWAAWNYHIPRAPLERVAVTYNMNILQTLEAPEQFLVSLNRSAQVDPRKVLGRYVYHHPLYSAAAVAAQRRRREINGVSRTYFCGAYWGYGFHEDGVQSAADALEEFARRQRYAQPNLQRVG